MAREIDLSDFGFAAKKLLCEGDIVDKKNGKKLLFLVAETHKEKASICPNVRNCIRLADAGIVGLVGLEFNPKDEDVPAKHVRTGDLAADVESIVQADLERIGEPRFGTTVRRLADVPVEVVEDMELWEKAGEVESEVKQGHLDRKTREIFEKLMEEKPGGGESSLGTEARKQAEADSQVITQFRKEFGDHPINVERDKAIVANIMKKWAQVGSGTVAVLNAGRKHIERIKYMLPEGVGFICVIGP